MATGRSMKEITIIMLMLAGLTSLVSLPTLAAPVEIQPITNPAHPLNTLLPNVFLTAPSVKESRAGAVSPMDTNTYSQDFGKIYPAAVGSSSNGGTWQFSNPNSVTIQVVVSMTSNPYGAYAITVGGGTTNLAPGQGMNVTVQFSNSGQSSGTKTGQMRIQWLYNGSTFTDNYYNLTGVVANMYDLTGSYAHDFGSVYLDSPVDGTVRLQNSGGLVLTTTGFSLGGPDAGEFQITGGDSSASLATGQYQDVNVRYMANTAGSHSAYVMVRRRTMFRHH